ncbi:MAG: sugar transferase [Burkholderiales bacterium]|nr:sugar transferase [Burkholderiales bacterium]
MAKRLLDLVVSALSLLLLAPLMLLIALAIRMDSAGPVFFRQERVGRAGRLFRIHKFRTMRLDAEQGGLQVTVGRDPRITRVGHWLRGRRLDELPQLIDVLRGDMSLVGPRPEVPRFVAHYPTALRDEVLAVRPGLTDPATLAHLDEAPLLAAATDPERAYIDQVLPRKLALQAEYVRRATLGGDLILLWRTLCVLVRR